MASNYRSEFPFCLRDRSETHFFTSFLEECLTGDIPVELATEKETQECNAVTVMVCLVSITESDQINKDAEFLTK